MARERTIDHRAATGRFFAEERHDHGRCVSAALGEAAKLCERRGARLTSVRRRVLELVWTSHEPIGAYAVLEQLRREGRAAQPPTVYRALDFLLAQGLVHRLASLNAFIGCTRPARPHRGQFLICRACGDAAELDDVRIGTAIAASTGELGFAVERVTVEVSGRCPRCVAEPGVARAN